MEAKVTLSDAIENVREEIARAIEKGEGKSVKFALNEVELELGVEVEERDAASGEVKIVVVRFGAELADTAKNIHRIKIKLTPVNGDGEPLGPFIVSGERTRPE